MASSGGDEVAGSADGAGLAGVATDALLLLGELCHRGGEHLRALKALDRLREGLSATAGGAVNADDSLRLAEADGSHESHESRDTRDTA